MKFAIFLFACIAAAFDSPTEHVIESAEIGEVSSTVSSGLDLAGDVAKYDVCQYANDHFEFTSGDRNIFTAALPVFCTVHNFAAKASFYTNQVQLISVNAHENPDVFAFAVVPKQGVRDVQLTLTIEGRSGARSRSTIRIRF